MKNITWTINIILGFVILCSLIAAVGSAMTKEPVLLSVIRSNSMYPVWERGDMVVMDNMGEEEAIHNGDIIFFKTETGSLSTKGWIAHRVIGGNAEDGFITKGDANEYSDQEADGTGPIKREWIAGKAFTVGDSPIVIPKAGFLSLWVEKLHSNPLLLPIIALVLAGIIALGELKSGPKRKKKNKGIQQQLIYMVGGVTIAVIIGATMLSSGQKLNIIYEVSENSEGVLLGSDVGIMKVGDEISQPLSELSNGGFFPLIGTITTNDEQIKVNHDNLVLSQGEMINTTYTVTAKNPGMYESSVRIGLFYPFLPKSVIYFLAEKSYWLALFAVSIIPGLPLMAYPFINRKMRNRTMKALRRKKRKLLSAFN